MDEADIRLAVEERKKRAWELGVVESVFSLYREEMRFFSGNLERDRQRLPKSVINISKTTSRAKGIDGFTIEFAEASYTLSWREEDSAVPDSVDLWADLDVIRDGTLLLRLWCIGEDTRYMGHEWKIMDIRAFLDGPWVAEINKFAAGVKGISNQRRAAQEKDAKQRELEELKSRFGLNT